MKIFNYRIILRKEPEGGYAVIVPSLPGCVTFGETIEESIDMAREAIGIYIDDLIAEGEEVPNDDQTLEYNLSVESHA